VIDVAEALLLARMAANSTLLVTKQPPRYCTSLERASGLIEALCAQPVRRRARFPPPRSPLRATRLRPT
jgi:hypothetical protein